MDILVIQSSNPLCKQCTVFSENGLCLSAVQERFDCISKCRWWDSIDTELAFAVRDSERFKLYFREHAVRCEPDAAPIFSIRKLMWAVGLKRPKLEPWEVAF